MNARSFWLVVLTAAVVASAVGSVYVQHRRHGLFAELQHLEAMRDAMQEQWGQLQLEHSAWGTQERIEKLAKNQLGFTVPSADGIVLVTP